MAFVVEDGTGITDANGYISTAFFLSYHADRGHTSATSISTDDTKTIIVRATDYIDKRFGRKFRGRRSTSTQGLQWPRIGAYSNDYRYYSGAEAIPTPLKKACAEYALRAAVYSELAPDPLLNVPEQDFTEAALPSASDSQGPGAIKSETEKVDVVEEQTSYQSPSSSIISPGKFITSGLVSSGTIPEYPAADLLMEELLTINRRTLIRG